jgi:hypothetical protein
MSMTTTMSIFKEQEKCQEEKVLVILTILLLEPGIEQTLRKYLWNKLMNERVNKNDPKTGLSQSNPSEEKTRVYKVKRKRT